MVDEVVKNGTLEGLKRPVKIVGYARRSNELETVPERDTKEPTEEEVAYREALMTRVLKREQVERGLGVDEDVILSRRAEKEAQVRLAMCTPPRMPHL